MELESYEDGVPSWVDLNTPDLEASAAFYTSLFGWEAPQGSDEFGGYRTCLLRGKPVAGIGPQMSPGPVYWSTYVNVADADATAARASARDGKILFGPTDVGPSGRLAIISDPQGGVIGLWQPDQHRGAEIVNEPGAFTWCELITPEPPLATEFYEPVFGWTHETHDMEGFGTYTEWKVGGRTVAGMMPTPEMLRGSPPFWSVYFAVDDTDAAVARVAELGGTTLRPAMDAPPGRFAVVADPLGAAFTVIKLANPPS